MVKKETATRPWTPRSQASLLRQLELEREREALANGVEAQKRRLAEAKEMQHRLAKSAAKGEGWAVVNLEKCTEDVRNKRGSLEAQQEVLRSIEEAIAALEPTPKQLIERRKQQDALAALVEERLTVDAALGVAVDELRSRLMKRAELTGRMAELARALEMTCDLDQARFDALAQALSEQVEPQSRTWAQRMLGQGGRPVRAIARHEFTVSETLADAGVYHRGDEVFLSEGEFAELRRTDRPAPGLKATWPERVCYIGIPRWRCHPRKVWTPEEYEAAQKQVEEEGVTLAYIVISEDRQQDEQNQVRAERRAEQIVRVKVLRGGVLRGGITTPTGGVTELPYGTAESLAEQGQVEIL